MALHTLSQREIILKVRSIIPPLLEHFHKGQHGRVAVVGGCEDYTGAPYFSAAASALLGADMSHVICDTQAATVIKSYSPNIMVHPYLRSSTPANSSTLPTPSTLHPNLLPLLSRVHVLVIGPGLGRDPHLQHTAGILIQEARKRGLGLVLDADSLFLVQNNPEIIRGYKNAILTPNVMEFKRLCTVLEVSDGEGQCSRLAQSLGGVTVIQKGPRDVISNGTKGEEVFCTVRGGLKRSGGQGDTLTGSLGTFLAWKKAYQEGLWESKGDNGRRWEESELMMLCAYGAAAVTRTASRRAFEKKGRALQASDLSLEVGGSFEELFESKPEELTVD
ncbi:Ribokinase-like protein [Peziza echinospora]|nr:Ribokinase-like protein [Peziza echinospora]